MENIDLGVIKIGKLSEMSGSPAEALVNLYKNPYSTLQYFRIFHEISDKETYALTFQRENGHTHILCFTINKGNVFIKNGLILLSNHEIRSISSAILDYFGAINNIYFEMIYREDDFRAEKNLWVYKSHQSNDAILILPKSLNEYLSTLGNKTRKHAKYYFNRIKRDFPDFKVEFYQQDDISFHFIQEIVKQNRSRMRQKGEKSGLDKEYELRLGELGKSFGLVCTCKIDGQVVAGTMNTMIKDQAFLHIIAHDPKFDKYDLGQIALISTVEYLINHEINAFHMLWGNSEYKYRYGCKDARIDYFTVSRNRYNLYKVIVLSLMKKTIHYSRRAVAKILLRLRRAANL